MTDTESALGHQTVDLLPSEITRVKEAQVQWNRRLQARAKRGITIEEAYDWGREVESYYRNELGLVAIVDPYGDLALTDDAPLPEVATPEEFDKALASLPDKYFKVIPTVVVTGRVKDEAFDFDQAQQEVQTGLLDGIVGRIDEKGVWHDPKTNL